MDRLLRAFRFLLSKHKVLRTSLSYHNDDNTLKQCITHNHQRFNFADEQTFENETDLNNTIYQILTTPNLFDLSNGHVFQCQILRQRKLPNDNNDNKLITPSDILIIAGHHAALDRLSFENLLQDLCLAYNNNTIWSIDEHLLQYIDYSVYERLIDMSLSSEFWHLQLEGYNLEHPLSLLIDRHRSFNDQRSGLASVVQISFHNEILTPFLHFASSHQLTPFQLSLAIFYLFLFKLFHGQSDLCISCLNANRHRAELQNMIGMFVATLPYRIQLDPLWSFDELVKRVREKCFSILDHSHYPLQHILADSHLNQSDVSFLETKFDFITISSNMDRLSFDGTSLEQVSLKQQNGVAKFDFMLTLIHNPTSNDDKLSCRFVCSRDLFDERTVTKIAGRFQHIFEQLFSSKFSIAEFDKSITPINKLSLILSEETLAHQGVVFNRLQNIINEGMSMI
jgi:hypothetical protein